MTDSSGDRKPFRSGKPPRQGGGQGGGQRRGGPDNQRRRGGEGGFGGGAGRASDAGARRAPRPEEPDLPDEVQASDLDPTVRRDLLSLDKSNAEAVARHLVMASRLV